MTNKELSAKVRKDLKDAGFGSKRVHVRVRDSGYSTAVDLEIVDPLVRKSEVMDVVKKYSHVRYDERSQEILAGCNTFVHAQYSYNAFDNALTPELLGKAENLFKEGVKSGYNKEIANSGKSALLMGKPYADKDFVTVCEVKLENQGYGSYVKTDENIWNAKTLALRLWQFQNWGTLA